MFSGHARADDRRCATCGSRSDVARIQKSPHLGAAGKQELSEAEVKAFVEGFICESVEPFLREAVTHADSRFRNKLFEAARAEEGVTQRHIVETSPVPVAAVNGGADRAVNLDYSSVA